MSKKKDPLREPYTLEEWAKLIQVWSGLPGKRISDAEALAVAKREYNNLAIAGDPLPTPADMM